MTIPDAVLTEITRLGFDTSPFIYFVERHPAYLPMMRDIVRMIDEGIIKGYGSVITLTEVLVLPRRNGETALAFEFVRRRIKPEGLKIKTPSDVLPLIHHYGDRKQEHFLCVSINGANEVMNVRVVTIGLINKSQVHPREVFADVIAERASAVIVAHNHPGGELKPSREDIQITR